jgi:hypothetical protein
VQQHHPSLVNAKQNASNAATRQVAANFPQPLAHRPAERHADRPGKLDVLDVFTNDLSIFTAQCLEPITDRFSARRQLIEGSRQSLHAFPSNISVSKLVRIGNRKIKYGINHIVSRDARTILIA